MWEEVYLSTVDNKERFVLSLDVSEISPLNVDYINSKYKHCTPLVLFS
jgi:hypothetical protein